MSKRRHSSSSTSDNISLPLPKRQRIDHPNDYLSPLSDELLIRILHYLPLPILLRCELISNRFRRLSLDSQLWKRLYYNRFVLPRALRIPGVKTSDESSDGFLLFSDKRSRWLNESGLLGREASRCKQPTNWKARYRLRHNWARGACEIGELLLGDGRGTEMQNPRPMLVGLGEGLVVTVDRNEGLRAWNLRDKTLVAQTQWEGDLTPTCLAVDEQGVSTGAIRIAVGLEGKDWETWTLDEPRRMFVQVYKSREKKGGTLSAIAYAYPYVLTITQAQTLSLYTFDQDTSLQQTHQQNEKVLDTASKSPPSKCNLESAPRLLTSLKSNTTWPPLCLSIRFTPAILIASIAYSFPTYLSGFTVGLQELRFSLRPSPSFPHLISSRLASAQPAGFQPLLTLSTSPSQSVPPTSTRPTNLSYSHPYILAIHSDNTLALYLCTSTAEDLTISQATKLWGHTSGISSAEITSRGKAVSVSARGEELRVWELEGGKELSRRKREGDCVIVKALPETRVWPNSEEVHARSDTDLGAKGQWVGFDDEVVIVLKEGEQGTKALMVYDFT